jgi:hypothetical protein
MIDSVNMQKKKLDKEVQNEHVDLNSLFLQDQEKENLEKFITDLNT